MKGLSNPIQIILAAVLILSGDSLFAREKTSPRADALLLYGANWCAPCLTELRDLPALAAAHAPAPIILLWEDGPPRALWPSWPDNAAVGSMEEAVAAIESGTFSAGLPFAVLLDEAAQPCSVWKGKLTVERLGRLRSRCRDGRQ